MELIQESIPSVNSDSDSDTQRINTGIDFLDIVDQPGFEILLNKSDQSLKSIVCSLQRMQVIKSSQIWRSSDKWWESCMRC